VDASVNVYNHEFQKVLNAFQDAESGDGRKLLLSLLNGDDDELIFEPPSNQEEERKLAEQAKISGKFNLYNVDMVPSIYWYAYGGSLPRVSLCAACF
jgi:hypothetical protein